MERFHEDYTEDEKASYRAYLAGEPDPVFVWARDITRDSPLTLKMLTQLWAGRFGVGEQGARSVREALDTFEARERSPKDPAMDIASAGTEARMAENVRMFQEVVTRIAGRDGVVSTVRLGRWLARHAGCPMEGFRFVSSTPDRHAKRNTWMVERVQCSI